MDDAPGLPIRMNGDWKKGQPLALFRSKAASNLPTWKSNTEAVQAAPKYALATEEWNRQHNLPHPFLLPMSRTSRDRNADEKSRTREKTREAAQDRYISEYFMKVLG